MLKRIYIAVCLLLLTLPVCAQEGLMLGRQLSLPDPGEKISLHYSDSVPVDSLERYAFILIFSSAHSKFSASNIDDLKEFVINGGSLYIGADNWPLFEESNQMTFAMFGKYCWGDQDLESAAVNNQACSNGVFATHKKIPSGKTTVSFPLDYRLKVEAWSGDEPLVLSGKYGKGRIVLDGGYSRFNTELFVSAETGEVFREIIRFLVEK